MWRTKIILLTVASFITAHAAEGLITKSPTILYDGPSVKASKKIILSGQFPLRQIVRLAGWKKVETYLGDQGWVSDKDIKKDFYVVVTKETAGVYTAPNSQSPLIFYAQRGVILEVVKPSVNNYLEVVHGDGESGFIIESDVWRND